MSKLNYLLNQKNNCEFIDSNTKKRQSQRIYTKYYDFHVVSILFDFSQLQYRRQFDFHVILFLFN